MPRFWLKKMFKMFTGQEEQISNIQAVIRWQVDFNLEKQITVCEYGILNCLVLQCWSPYFNVGISVPALKFKHLHGKGQMCICLFSYNNSRLATTLLLWHGWFVEAPNTLSCCRLKFFPLSIIRVPFPIGMELYSVPFT